ncbi:MAG: hypothetical protein ABIF82_15150, partial [Planctomycetota bacterium]
HVSYGVHESDELTQVTAIVCERDYAHVRKGILECAELTVVSEGHEQNISGTGGPAKDEGHDACGGGRIMKIVVAVTES